MCIILDASVFSDYVKDVPDMRPVRGWLEGKKGSSRRGKLAYSPTKKFQDEVRKHRFRNKLVELQRAGLLKEVPAARVTEVKNKLPKLRSNDPHVVALAIAARVTVLVSRDQDLHEDFKTLAGGKVYQKATHRHLLKPDMCD